MERKAEKTKTYRVLMQMHVPIPSIQRLDAYAQRARISRQEALRRLLDSLPQEEVQSK